MAQRKDKLQLEINFTLKEFVKFGHKGRYCFPLKSAKSDHDGNNFDLTWLEYFKKHDDALYKKLLLKKDVYTVMDRRNSPNKKIWKLSAHVRDFINSFRNQLTYKADVGILKANTITNSTGSNTPATNNKRVRLVDAGVSQNDVGRVGRSDEGGPHRSGGTSNLKRKNKDSDTTPVQTSKHSRLTEEINIGARSKNQTESRPTNRNQTPMNFQSIHVPLLPEVVYDYDCASMAESMDSQESQMEDLRRDGIAMEVIKPSIIRKLVEEVDNSALLRVKHELKKLIASRTWFRATRHIPHTANLLQRIFLDPTQ